MKPATTGERHVWGDGSCDNTDALRELRESDDPKIVPTRVEAAAIDAAIDAAVLAERERCAKVADEHAKRSFNWASENAETYHAQSTWAERIAAAIREGKP